MLLVQIARTENFRFVFYNTFITLPFEKPAFSRALKKSSLKNYLT